MTQVITKTKLFDFFAKKSLQTNKEKPLTGQALAAVLVPIIDDTHGLSVIFTERTQHLKHHAGQISFPGGRQEIIDIDLTATALRETTEEIGLNAANIQILGSLSPLFSTTGFLVTPFVGIVTPPFALTIDATEVASVFTVPLDYLLNPAHQKQQLYLHQGKSKNIYVIDYQERRIWGLTARILVELTNKMREK